ncbi:MAG: cell surface protein SprA [Hyphomicrobiales bacterium]
MLRQMRAGLLLGLAVPVLLAGGPVPARADLRFRELPDSTELVQPLADSLSTLPAGWRLRIPAATGGYGTTGDPTVSVTIDPVTGRVRESYREGDVEVRDPVVTSNTEYTALLAARTTRRLWRDSMRGTRSVQRGTGPQKGLFRVELPVQLPKAVRSIVGDGAPNLEVSGSETISLAGNSDWTASPVISTERQRQSAFPSFEMKQDLNVNLTGSIGDKIKVDVDQSSNVQTSLDNKVKLRYEGDDDDMIKSVELGNTNLSLAGASIRQDGLFGLKTEAKLGNVDVVTVASKQDAKNETARFTPSGDLTRVIVRDVDYIRNQYFFIADKPVNIDYSTLEIWKDQRTSATQGTTPGIGRLDPTNAADSLSNPELTGNFTPLYVGTDYEIRDDYWILSSGLKIPVIRLATPLARGQVLAVSYVDKSTGVDRVVGFGNARLNDADPTLGKVAGQLLLKVISKGGDLGTTPEGNFDPADPWYRTIGYELRNFYNLGAANISIETLQFKIRKIDNGSVTDPDQVNGTSYLQILGLDQKSQNGASVPDGQLDAQYLDTDRGIVFFPDLTPFAPTSRPSLSDGTCAAQGLVGYSGFLCLNDSTRNILRPNASEKLLEANPLIYEAHDVTPSTDTRFYIDASFKSSRNGYYIGRFNILEGSEVVRVDGVPQKRDTDYRIDYDAGQITFIHPPGPDQVVTVDYSFAPGVGQVQRTLLGFSTTYNPAANLSFSSSMLYERRGALEQNVKLGEEPATSMLGDLSTVLSFRPVWMTQLTNSVPGVHTSQPSALNIQANASTSIPNPNTKGEAYIDDMEGNRDSNTISLLRTQWMWSSVPVDPVTGAQRSPDLSQHALIQWYLPKPGHVLEHDLKPVLRDEEGGKNEHQSLEINMIPPTGQPGMLTTNWTGITQPISTVGVDFSKVQYIEVWVNDFKADHTQTHGTLHLDFGRVSEDAYWDKNAPPNGKLDTEDKDGNGQLSFDEDTGLDGVADAQEPGYSPTTNPDPNGDDYDYTTGSDDYSKINNTENNGKGDPNAKPDTEDLNRNGVLDTYNNYYETSLDLTDTSYVAIDIPRDYADLAVVRDNKYGNGWRLYRIPLDGQAFQRIGSASWTNVQSVRLWVDGMDAPLRIQVGGIELVGNRWLKQAIADSSVADRVTWEVQNRNNKDDLGFYESPYGVQNATGTTAKQREQSLALVYQNLVAGDTLFAFKSYGDPGTALGWAQYQELRFYVHGQGGVEAENLRAVARFGPDTVNYYEYSIPLRTGWQNVVIPMQRLSSLKESRRGQNVVVDSTTAAGSGEIYTVVGNPSFTRITRVSFGVVALGGTVSPGPAGEVWYDDLRLSDVRKDKGFASNVSVQANFADLLAMNVSYQTQNQDYFRVGQGANQGTGLDHKAIGFSSTLNLDRFIATSGVQLPVRFTMQHSTDVPKFRSGSDVVLGAARSDVETRRFDRQSVDLSYSRAGPRKGITRYTLDAITTSMSYSRQGSINPQSADSTWSFNTNAGYNLPIGGGGFSIGRRMKVNLLPETFRVGANWISSRTVSYSRTLTDTSDVRDYRSDVKQRLLDMNANVAYVPLSGVRTTYSLRSQRDMLLHDQGPFGWNKGTEVRHEQGLDLNYRPRWLSFLSPTIQLHGGYTEDASPDRRILLTDQLGTKTIQNSGTAQTNFTIPISRIGQGARRSAGRDTSGVSPFLVPLRFVLGKLQDVSAGFDFTRGSTISRVFGDPGFAFKTGFTQVIRGDLEQLSNSTVQTSRRYSSRANTSFRPIQTLNFDFRADHQLAYTDQVYGARRSLTVSWPDVKARWSDVQRLLGLQSALSSLALNSSYQVKKDEQGPVGGVVDQRTITTTFGPLLGWEASFRNGVRASISTSFTKTETSDDRPTGLRRLRQSVSSLIQLNKVFPASKGIKLPWSKNRIRLPNDLNLGATVNLSSDRQSLFAQNGQEYPEQDSRNLNVQSSTNYNFSQSISGGFNLGFRQYVDNRTKITRRGITIAFNATFRF